MCLHWGEHVLADVVLVTWLVARIHTIKVTICLSGGGRSYDMDLTWSKFFVRFWRGSAVVRSSAVHHMRVS